MIGISGASGFVGMAVYKSLLGKGLQIRPFVRRQHSDLPSAHVVGQIGAHTDWGKALDGIESIVHCAAHVHQMNNASTSALAEYREVNTLGTLHLAEAAAKAGVRRFIFISSVKVMGESTSTGRPFKLEDAPAPLDPYGVSKWEAEQGLWATGQSTGLEVVVIRPPLVYGPGVGANFRQLLKLVQMGIPLPFAGIDNRRSLVSVDNLVDLIALCLSHPDAPGNTFLVSDDHDLSTPALVAAMAQAMGKKTRLFNVPVFALQTLGKLTGRQSQIDRLTQNLQVDIGHTQQILGWTPKLSLEEGMDMTVQNFKANETRV